MDLNTLFGSICISAIILHAIIICDYSLFIFAVGYAFIVLCPTVFLCINFVSFPTDD